MARFLMSVCFFLLSVFLFGCSTVEFPAGHLTSPEVPGKNFSFELGIGSQENRVVFIAEESDEGNEELELREDTEFKGVRRTSFTLGIGFLESLYVAIHPGLSLLQWQFLGSPRSSAQEGNFSASIFYGSGNSFLKSTLIKLANQEKNLDGEVKLSSQVAGLNFGYRLSPGGGFGLSFFAQTYNVDATGDVTDFSGESSVKTENVTLTRKATDIGVGVPIFAGTDSFQFLLMPTYIMIKEAVREDSKKHHCA